MAITSQRRKKLRPSSRSKGLAAAHRADLLPANVGNGSSRRSCTKALPPLLSARSLAISPPHWIPSIVAGERHAPTAAAAAYSAGSGGLRYLRAARRRQVPSHGCSEGHRPI